MKKQVFHDMTVEKSNRCNKYYWIDIDRNGVLEYRHEA